MPLKKKKSCKYGILAPSTVRRKLANTRNQAGRPRPGTTGPLIPTAHWSLEPRASMAAGQYLEAGGPLLSPRQRCLSDCPRDPDSRQPLGPLEGRTWRGCGAGQHLAHTVRGCTHRIHLRHPLRGAFRKKRTRFKLHSHRGKPCHHQFHTAVSMGPTALEQCPHLAVPSPRTLYPHSEDASQQPW